MTFGDIKDELHISSNRVLNHFLDVFDLRHNQPAYVSGPKYNGIRNYQEIKGDFPDALRSYKDQLNSFQKDYYQFKSLIEISRRIGVDVQTLLSFTQERIHLFDVLGKKKVRGQSEMVITRLKCDALYVGASKKGLIVPETELGYISSFNILKVIQRETLRSKLGVIRFEKYKFSDTI